MAKERCQICGQSKAKRVCKIKEKIPICPVCCSKLRSGRCEGCTHYETSVKYQVEKPHKEKHFVTLINPEIDEECDRILSIVESGGLSRGEKLMRELCERQPHYHTVLYGMGVCYALQNKLEEAIECFKKAVAIFPLLTEAHFNMAMAYTRLGNIPGLVRAFREVIRIGGKEELVSEAKGRLDDIEQTVMRHNGFNLDTYLKNNEIFDKAFAALENQEFVSAIDLFERVLATDPRHVQTWGNLGLAYAGVGERRKALKCLDKALELDSSYEIAAVNRITVEKMKEGECIEGPIESVDYYRDYRAKGKKSYIAEVLGNIGGVFKKADHEK